MRQQILEALKAKFQGVSDAILGRIADKLAKTITTAEQIVTAVDGVTIQQVIESYGDSRATEAQQTAVHNYEQKHGLKHGVKVDDKSGNQNQGGQGGQTTQTQTGGAENQTNALLKQLLDQNKKLTERMDAMDKNRITTSRKQQLSDVINKLPETLRKGYERMSVDNLTDEQFNSLVTEVTAEVDGIIKDTNQKGAVFGRPSAQQGSAHKGGELTEDEIKAISKREESPKDGQPF